VFRDALTELKRQGTLRQLTGGLHYDVAALAALREKVAEWFHGNKELTPGDLKSLSGGLTRKHAIPLLEWLDGEGMTRRQGDVRVAGPKTLASRAGTATTSTSTSTSTSTPTSTPGREE